MIPKIIHYCWFGHNPLPELAIKCIDSWKKFLPDYEIREWNEDNFDVNIIPYTEAAYKAKKYAFVSDYARFWILYKYGGVYFDTDVEVIRPMDDIIEIGPFMGCEKSTNKGTTPSVAPGLGLGVTPGLDLYKDILEFYHGYEFVLKSDSYKMVTIVDITTNILLRHGLKNEPGIQFIDGVYIYPSEYFCPIDIITKRLRITENSRTIHHYAASWTNQTLKKRIKTFVRKMLPSSVLYWYNETHSPVNKND